MKPSKQPQPERASAKPSRLRQRWKRWTRPPRRLSFTTSGKYFVLLTLGIGFGAVNTGDNLLFLLLGMMLSLILASGVLSEAVIRKLHARRSAPARSFAGHIAPGSFHLHNPGGWPALSIEIAERRAHGLSGPLAGQKLGPDPIPWWKFWRRAHKEDPARRDIARAYTMRIESQTRQQLPARYFIATRGRFKLPGLDIITRFPFGLFEKRRELDLSDELIVYPAARESKDWLADVHARFGDVARNKRGFGEDFFGLRDYQPGEDQRLIHWKSTARRGEVVVRETEQLDQRAIEVCLLNATGRPAHQRHQLAPLFETGLERTVGLIQSLLASGWRVGLRTLDSYIPADDASNHIDRMLTELALVELKDGAHSIKITSPSDDNTNTTPKHTTTSAARILVGLKDATATSGLTSDLVLIFDQDTDHASSTNPVISPAKRS